MTNDNHAHDQAVLQTQTITELMACKAVDFSDYEEARDELARAEARYQKLLAENSTCDWDYADKLDSAIEELEAAREAMDEFPKEMAEFQSEDDLREAIDTNALSIEFRSGWSSDREDLEPEEVRVVLCTGGPHVEIVADFDSRTGVSSPRVLYRDWGTSGELFDFDHSDVVAYLDMIVGT